MKFKKNVNKITAYLEKSNSTNFILVNADGTRIYKPKNYSNFKALVCFVNGWPLDIYCMYTGKYKQIIKLDTNRYIARKLISESNHLQNSIDFYVRTIGFNTGIDEIDKLDFLHYKPLNTWCDIIEYWYRDDLVVYENILLHCIENEMEGIILTIYNSPILRPHLIEFMMTNNLNSKYVTITEDVRQIVDVALNTNHRI